jgi:hypothetical protein
MVFKTGSKGLGYYGTEATQEEEEEEEEEEDNRFNFSCGE